MCAASTGLGGALAVYWQRDLQSVELESGVSTVVSLMIIKETRGEL